MGYMWFFLLLIALRKSVKIIVSCRWWSIIISSAFSMENDFAVKTEGQFVQGKINITLNRY